MAITVDQNLILASALEFQTTMQNNGWRFCYIGGLAVLRWGNIRMTQDIDVCLECGFGLENNYIPGILESFESRISNPDDFAVKNRVLLIKTLNGISVDVSL